MDHFCGAPYQTWRKIATSETMESSPSTSSSTAVNVESNMNFPSTGNNMQMFGTLSENNPFKYKPLLQNLAALSLPHLQTVQDKLCFVKNLFPGGFYLGCNPITNIDNNGIGFVTCADKPQFFTWKPTERCTTIDVLHFSSYSRLRKYLSKLPSHMQPPILLSDSWLIFELIKIPKYSKGHLSLSAEVLPLLQQFKKTVCQTEKFWCESSVNQPVLFRENFDYAGSQMNNQVVPRNTQWSTPERIWVGLLTLNNPLFTDSLSKNFNFGVSFNLFVRGFTINNSSQYCHSLQFKPEQQGSDNDLHEDNSTHCSKPYDGFKKRKIRK